MEVAQHHILFPQKLWDAQKPTRQLRRTHELIPLIHREPHEALHRNLGIVAVPSFAMAEQIASKFHEVKDDPLRSTDNLMFAIEDVRNSHRTSSIERQLANLMLLGIDQQRMYIIEGLVVPDGIRA